MVKILTIGDIHGREIWKEFLFGTIEKFEAWKEQVFTGKSPEFETSLNIVFSDVDKVVFVGDYFDSFTVSNGVMKANVLDIFLLKRQYPDKVFLLWGNHDVHYWDSSQRCSGFRAEMYYDFHDIVSENANLLDFSHQVGNVIWTHAGITADFLQLCKNKYKGMERYPGETEELDTMRLADFLNEMWKYKWKALFFCGRGRGGSDPVPGPLWADRWELTEDPPEGLHQFVGHTPVEEVCGAYIENVFSVNFVDCLERGLFKSVVVVNVDDEGKYSNFEIYEAERKRSNDSR